MFQSTLPRGERQKEAGRKSASHCFNPRSRAGSDRHPRAASLLVQRFNPRSRAGSDEPAPALALRAAMFQSTLPRGERRRRLGFSRRSRRFQSTLPRGERRLPAYRSFWGTGFNPRSRAGSDAKGPQSPPPSGGFNPRSRAGSDKFARSDVVRLLFQSTLPRGERPHFLPPVVMTKRVSIHAPARGATPLLTTGGDDKTCFNPRSRAGSDPY